MKRIVRKIIMILCIISLLNNYNVALAVDVATAGQALASYAYNFYKKGESGQGAALTTYVKVNDTNNSKDSGVVARTLSYLGKPQNGYYGMDCVGWISFAVHNCLKIGPDNAFEYFVWPENCKADYFEKVSDELKPGDVLVNTHHAYLYIGKIDGKDTIVHCRGWGGPGGPKATVASGWGVNCEYLEDYESKSGNQRTGQFRITEACAASIDSSQISTEGALLSNGSLLNNVNMSNFYYNGIPDGKYSVTKGFWDRLIDLLAEIFDFLIGIMTMLVRMVFVGWTAIFETLITSTVKTVSGDSDILSVPVTSTDVESNENISIEKIVFNQISVFDVNFFNNN